MPTTLAGRLFALTIALLGAACGSSVPLPEPQQVAPGEGIPLAVAEGRHSGLADPSDPEWQRLREYLLATAWAPPVHPSVALRYDHTAPSAPVRLQIARDAERLYLRLRWSDATSDRTNAHDRFADAAAVQFALEGGIGTPYTMGSPSAPVNIWYWRAGDAEAQNLAAGGFGTLSPIERAELSARGVHGQPFEEEWAVVFSRPLRAEGMYQVDLASGEPLYVSLGVWEGSAGQRDGLKRTTVGWVVVELPVEPMRVAR